MLKMGIDGVYYDPGSKSPVIILSEEGSGRKLPIWIGAFEAMAIISAMEKTDTPRPITHDLTADLVRKLGAAVSRVEVTKIVDGTFFANVLLRSADGGVRVVDARPSDAIALAVRFNAPVYVSLPVLIEAGRGVPAEGEDVEEYWKRFLENLEPEAFGKYTM